MKDEQQLDSVAAYAVRNDIGRTGDYQLPSAGYAPRTTQSREMFQRFDRSYDCGYGPGSSFGIILGDVVGHGNQVRACRS
jgi:hypothetical protein